MTDRVKAVALNSKVYKQLGMEDAEAEIGAAVEVQVYFERFLSFLPTNVYIYYINKYIQKLF